MNYEIFGRNATMKLLLLKKQTETREAGLSVRRLLMKLRLKIKKDKL